MTPFLTTIIFDYLQRCRSYAFLITMCISLAIAYTFVPEPNASYSTLRIGDYQGIYNAAWIGYVTAIMTASFLSLTGFYLINNSIKNDIDSKVGQIVASTKLSNFTYLFSKVISNFLVLLTIAGAVFIMSIILFFLYNDGSAFNLLSFIKPYTLITLPALFVVAVLGIAFEILLGKHTILQNLLFFFLFSTLMTLFMSSQISYNYDIFGGRIVTTQMEAQVNQIIQPDKSSNLSIGFTNGGSSEKFIFTGIDFPITYIISRLLWILLGIIIIIAISPLFHRFNVKERLSVKRTQTIIEEHKTIREISLSNLPKPQINYGIFPLIKTELLLLFRKGKRWMWLINFGGMIFLALLPINIAYQLALPILWFFQVNRLASLTTKEVTNHVHYFAFSSYKPLSRLLAAQLLAGILMMVFLAVPLILRFSFEANLHATLSILAGGIFIVLVAATFGILTKGKKLFEVLFFMVSYANTNGISFLDYFGATTNNLNYIAITILVLTMTVFLLRKYELNSN